MLASAEIALDILARDHTSGTFDKISGSAGRTTGPLSRMGQHLKGVAKWAGLAAGAAVVFAGKALWEMAKNAADDEAAQRKLAIAMHNTVNASKRQVAAVERYISKASIAKGITDDELRPAFQRLVQATGSVKEAQRQMGIAMDVSAGTGKSLKTVSEALMKANNGTTASLSRLGLKTKDAEGNTLSLDAALKVMSKTYGGQAKAAAGTFEGQQRRLQIVFDETKEALGAKLLPALTAFGGWLLDKGIPAISRISKWLSNNLGPAFSAVGGWVKNDFLPGLRSFADDVGPGVSDIMKAVKDALKDASPFFRLVGKLVTDVLLPGLGWLGKHVLPVVADQLRFEGRMLRKVGEAGVWMWNNALAPAFKLWLKTIGWVTDKFGDLFGMMAKIPGAPPWIKKTADALHAVSKEANAAADAIKRIDTHKDVYIQYHHVGQVGAGARDPELLGRSAAPSGRQAAGVSQRASVGAVSADSLGAALRRYLDGAVLTLVGQTADGQLAYRIAGGSSYY